MSDELDPMLLQAFARSERAFPDAEFVARVAAQLRPRGSLTGIAAALPRAVVPVLRGLALGIVAPLRLRYAGFVAVAGALVAVWSLLPSA